MKKYPAGIDRIELYNLKVTEESLENFDSMSIRGNKVIYTDRSYHRALKVSIETIPEGEKRVVASMDFNPNYILTQTKKLPGSNKSNSQSKELKKALEKIMEDLRKKGIELDCSEARIGKIEINKNLPLDFSEYSEAIFACYAGEKKVEVVSSGEEHQSYLGMTKNRTVYYNRVNYRGVIYDKTREIQAKGEKDFKEVITRFEWKFEKGYYKKVAESLGHSNLLIETIDKFEVIEKIFMKYTTEKWIKVAFKNIDKKIKPTLKKGYKEFKRTSDLQKKNGIKSQRDVMRYLEEKYWVFDHSYLLELVKEYDAKHYKRELKRISGKYSHHNNLEKFNRINEFLFLRVSTI